MAKKKRNKKKSKAAADAAAAATVAAIVATAAGGTAAAPAEEKKVAEPVTLASPTSTMVSAKDAQGVENMSKEQREMLKLCYGIDKLKAGRGAAKAAEEKKHKFWNTQPVPAMDETTMDNSEIETKTLKDVRKEPYPLPSQFEWCDCDISDPKVVDEVYTLLCENYVEDDDNMFRFDYSKDFLQWALKPPGFFPDWHVGVRVSTGSKKLVGFITGIPAHMTVYDKSMMMAEINFLCVHKRLRSKRLAPVLIKEVTRRVNLKNMWQAVYTAGVVLPKPIAQNRYWHRSLNPKKLIEIGFSHLQPRMTMNRTVKLYKVPEKTLTPGMRPLEAKDVKAACALLVAYLSKFKIAQKYTEDEFAHWLMPRKGVIHAFVVEDPETHKITDLISFYSLPSTIIGNVKHNTLRAAYSFYNVSTKTPWVELMTDALILARQLDFDVFNALNVMENTDFLKTLKFGIGDGHLQYYVYNWQCPEMKPKEVGLVLM